MGQTSTELWNMMTEFLIYEIGSKSIDGITYAFVIKNEKDKESYRKYMDIRKEASKCGYSTDEVFRVYEVNNGFIFDLDMQVAKKISYQLAKAVSKTNGGATPVRDLIGNSPERRRKADMVGLARYVKSKFDANQNIVEVALFSRNSTPNINVTCIGQNNEMLVIKYHAYAIRHWDIELINKNLLIPAGIRIAKLEPCEVLPSKTGVKFNLYLEPISSY